MEWHQLEYFKSVAQMQHVTHAAELLSISQPALSRSIAKLEEELGFPLFDRRGKNIVLNLYGKIFLQHVERAMQEISGGKKVILDLLHPDHGSISLSFLPISKPKCQRTIGIARMKDRYLSPAAQAFIKFVIDSFR